MQEDQLPGRRKALAWTVLAAVVALAAVVLLLLALLKARSADETPAVEDASMAADASADVSPTAAKVDAPKRVWRGRQITPSELRALQRRHRSMINYCYQRAARRAPSLVRTKTSVSVQLKNRGKVKSVEVHAGGDTQLEACLRRMIRGWRFPAALRTQKVDFSVVFAH